MKFDAIVAALVIPVVLRMSTFTKITQSVIPRLAVLVVDVLRHIAMSEKPSQPMAIVMSFGESYLPIS